MKNLNVLLQKQSPSSTFSGWMLILFLCFFTLGSETLMGQACPTAPTISSMTFSPADVCTNGNHAVVNATIAPVTPGAGYEYRYSLDGSPAFANSLPSGVPAGPHCITVAVFATTNVTCGGNTYTPGMMIPSTTTTYSIYFGTNGPPALAAASIVGNLTCAATISVIPNPLYSCFSYEYSIDGGAYSSTIPATLSRGCHTISYRLNTNSAGFFGCGTGNPTPASAITNFVLFDDLSTANITVNTTCSSGSNGTVSSVTGLPPAPTNVTYEYSLNGGAYSTALPTGIAPGCHNLMIRQMANCDNSTADGDSPSACRKVHNFVVYPTPPTIVAPSNTCSSNFLLPSVPAVPGFSVEYSVDGGPWSTTPFNNLVSNNSAQTGSTSGWNIISSSGNGWAASNPLFITSYGSCPENTASLRKSQTIDLLAAGYTAGYLDSAPDINVGEVVRSIFLNALCGAAGPDPYYVRYELRDASNNVIASFGQGTPGAPMFIGLTPLQISHTFSGYGPGVRSIYIEHGGADNGYWGGHYGAAFSDAYATVGVTLNDLAAGCHSIRARYVTAAACGSLPFNIVPAGSFSDGVTSSCTAPSNAENVVIFPEAPILTAPTNTCAAAFTLPTVTPTPGFNVQWSINGGAFTSTPVLPTTPGCYNIRAQYVLASACGTTPAGATGPSVCGISNTVNVVIFPQAPTITAPINTCNSAFTLPAVPAVPGFSVQYSIDGGAFAAAPTVPTSSGCYTVAARYVLGADCGATLANTAGPGACATSNTVSVVIFPTAPTLAQPASSCNAMFTLPTVTPVTGFNVEYELNNSGSWSAAPSTTLAGCYTVRARYVLAAACGTNPAGASSADAACAASAPVNALIYPAAPVITAPANTCNAAFTLPTVPSFVGFTTQYRVVNTSTGTIIDWTDAPVIPTTAGCYSVQARYVNTAACGTVAPLTAGPGACAESNTVNVIIFPTSAIINWANSLTLTDLQRCPGAGLTIFYAPPPTGFNIQLSWDGVWLAPGLFFPSNWFEVGCRPVAARYVLAADCGSTLAGTSGESIDPACGVSSTIYLHNTPPPPTITATANTCATMFTLPTVPAVPGYSVQYSVDNGVTWATNPSTTAAGCYSVRARYVLAAACGSFPIGTPALPACEASNAVQMTIFPDVTSNITSITKGSTCGNTNISVNWDVVPAVVPGFELRYSLDGGAYSTTLPTNIAPGCHSLSVRYALTSACGATAAGTVSPDASCEATRTFIVWPDLSTVTPTVSMAANCGTTTNVSTVTLSAPVSIPAGMELVYTGTNNGAAFGPVNLAGLQAINFATGCHNIRVSARATTACGVLPDGAAIGDIAPVSCQSASRDFITFPAPPTLTVTPVCSGGSLVAVPSNLAPAGYGWRYRLVNTVTNTVVGGWQVLPTWINPAVGCYEVEVVPVRTANCGSITAGTGILGSPQPVFPSNIQNPLDMQTAAIINAVPASFNAACVGSQDAFVLPAPPMAITPNNITVCLGDNGKIDLQYLEQMVPACLVDPATGVGIATVSYLVTSSDPLVVAPGTLNSLPNNAPELMWMGENGNNFPNVVTIGVTPQITLNGVTCQGAEVKFSITVQPNFAPTGGWQTSPNTAVQCANNNGWTLSTTANTDAACTYELYYNLSTSPLAAPIGNALVQTIAGNGAPVSFQPVFIPGTYQIWQRCGGCAELATTFTLSIIDAPALTDVLLETCPTTPGGNSGTFTGITYTLPTVPAPQSITVLGYYNSYNNAVNGGATGLISATAPFDYISSDAAIYVRIGHNVDGLPGDDCFYIGTIELRVVNRPIVTLTAIENPSCITQPVQLVSTVVAGSGVGYTYSWERVSPTAGPIAGTTGTVTVTEATPGDYVYRLTVTDPNNGTNGANGPMCTTVTDITVTYSGPIITCPANFTAATDAGSCNTFMNLIPAEINADCADEFTIRYWVTGATTIASMASPVTLSTINATAFNVGVNTVHAIAGTLVAGVFTPLAPEVSCTYTATVEDFEDPIANCKDITLFLDANGEASIVAADVDGGSSDNCGVASLYICPDATDFTGAFAPANWNISTTGVASANFPSSSNLDMIAGSLLLQAGQVNVCINIPASGTLSFDYVFDPFLVGSSVNSPFGYTINGVFTGITSTPPLFSTQSGTRAINVLAGQQFCFRQNATTLLPGGAATVSNMFMFESAPGLCNFTCNEIGQNDVTLLVTDVNGNASTCIANVTVVDAIAPTLVCPANITMNVSSNTVCTWTSGSLAPVTNTDNCTVPPVLTYTILNPDQTVANGAGAVNAYVFAKGTSVVTYSSADASGNISVCTFTVTVVDNVLPQFTGCPENITINITNAGFTVTPSAPVGGFVITQPATANDCSVNIAYTAPVASDNCPMFITQLTNGKGAAVQNYGAGTHTESYLVTDMSGNTATCSFVITVVDDRDPVITCPANVTVGTDPSAGCTAFVPLQPTVSDNCTDVAISHFFGNGAAAPSQLPNPAATSAATAVSGFTSGLFYPGTNGISGTTRVTFIATDLGGNTSTCAVDVTVTDDDAPVVSCPQDITLNANATCVGVLPAPYAAVFSDNCMTAGLTVTYAITGVTTANSPATGQNSVPTTQTFNLGTSFVTYTVTDAAGNRSTCTATVVVRDVTAPVITCPSVQAVYFVPANACVVNIPLVATATDNCSVASINHNDPFFNAGADATGNYGPGFYTIDFIATDGSGNTSLCTVNFEVRDNVVPTIACPTNVALNTGADDADCAAPHSWNHPTPTDNCTISLYTYRLELPNGDIFGPFNLTGTLLSGGSLATTYNFPVGTTRVRYNVRDVNGNINTCFFDVVVTDNTVPVFVQCPSNFTASNSPDLCSSTVTWANPIASDNCGYTNVQRTDAGPAQGGTWPIGTYVIRYLATDANNNTAVCTFTVTVVDTQNPEIYCPSVTQTFQTDNNTCSWTSTADAVAPRFNFDNCPYTVTYTITGATSASGNNSAAGSVFNLGTSTVTYRITEANGTLIGTCSFNIVVVDRQVPTITCPAGSPFVFSADNNACSYTVPATALNATATDNCTGAVTLRNNFNNTATLAGAVFPVGTTTVIWTATDVAGNTSTCSIRVTVEDRQVPTVSCASIPNNPLVTEIFRCESQMSWTHPIPADNCGVTVYTYSITNPDGTVAGPFTLTQLIAAGGNRNVAYDFEEGLSVLRYYVRDAAGNEGSCSLNITVVDRAMPFFTNCPSMIMVNNDVDRCSAKVNWDIPYAVDNCDVPLTVVAAPTNQFVPGDVIPVGGPYTIRYTATDNDGNTATCTFTILVLDSQQPEILVGKPQNITVECDNVPAPLVLNPNDVEDNCTAAPTIAFVQNSTKSPNQALCAHYNYTLTNIWTVRDASNNAQIWNQVVTVRDSKAPEITVPLNVTVECTGPYVVKSFTCNPATGSFAPTATFAEFGVAAAVDNCAPSQFICIEFTETFAPGTCGFTGVITRTWTATDPCGNRSSGVQRITIRDTRPPVFTCKNINVDLDADGKVSITAGDVIEGGIAGAVDACSAAADLTFQLSKLNFTCADLGPNQVLVKVIDDCGNEAACFATVTVRDVTRPSIICPGNQTFRLGSGQCTFQWPGAVPATDNCSAVVTYSPANLNLPIGTTVITATATDIAGNTATCSFTVVVQENIPSNTITCNDHINLSLDNNCEARINPDMLLEGNDYRCFDRYCIEITTLSGIPHANFFDISDKDQTFKVSIVDCNGTGNSCWGTVTIEEKLVPEINCPANVTVTCNTDVNERFIITLADGTKVPGALKTGEAFLRTCKPGAVITYKDWFDDRGQCATPRAIITRTWTSTYGNGETVSCDQIITIEGLNLDNIVWPADFTNDKALECTDVKQTPSLTNASNTGFPSLNGTPVNKTGNLCMVSVNVSDEIFDICPGSYEILRTWKVRNMCLPLSSTNPRVHVQVIKVNDTKGPKIIECPDDITIGVDPWGCVAHSDLPVPAVMVDGCSSVASFTAKVFGPGRTIVTGGFLGHDEHDIKVRVEGLEKGRHLVEYTIMDECGNISRCYYYVTVGDFSPPVAIGLQNIVLSLTGGEGDGFAKLYADAADNGSYDHCTDVKLEVRRLSGGSCGNIGANNHNNNSTYNHSPVDNVPNNVWAHPNDTRDNNIIIDTDGGEYVKFCCEDIPAGAEFGLHDVELRVWDDGNMNGVYGDNLIINGMRDNYNTTWVTVRVENKLPPVLVCPADVTVTCDMELNLSLDADTPVSSSLTMTGLPKAYDLCSNIDITYRDQWVGQFNDVCKSGTLRRTFKVTKGNTVVTCVQFITVTTITAPFTVTFPQNNTTTEWNKCSFDLADARDANNPVIKKPIVNYGQCDIVGENIKIDTFLFEDGACKKWRVEYNYKNWCTGEDRGPFVHFYTYKDEIEPVLTCQDQMFAANPSALNPNGGCEAQVALEASATDALVCADESWIKWQMFFDGWANGTVDRLASSFVNKSWNGIWVAQARLLATGAPNPVWAQLQQQHPGAPLADLVYVTYIRPTKASGETVKIPVGTGATAFILDAENISHKVLWKVTDGCGNVAQCESTVMVVDKKAPTPYCVSINTAVMQTNPKMVELWAKDFDKGAFDNCTPQSKLYFTFDKVAPIYSRINDEHFYKAGANGSVNATAAEYAQGRAYKWLPSARSAGKVWTTCGDFTVEVSVWDEAWNTDFCSTLLNIRGCDTNKPIVSGTVLTSTGNAVKNVNVTFETNLPEFPKTVQPDAAGNYVMEVVSDMDYEVSAAKGGDYLNGVTTLDLVLIQRHILGLDVFNDTYKVIASDANNDGRVTASDLTELRKVILGVNDEFRNASWRFPVKGQTLDAKNPFPYTDAFEYQGLNETKTGQDLVAVKIGDVNSSATTDVVNALTEPRSNTGIIFNVDETNIEAGQTVEIPFTASNMDELAGFQFTMNLKDAKLVGVNSGSLDVNNANIGILENGNVTMSYAAVENVDLSSNEVLFTISVKADKATSVSEMMTLNSNVTKAESYSSDLKVAGVKLNVRTAPISVIELFQNEPNPFRGQTTVSFSMPQAATATLSVYDLTGKLVVVRNIDAVKGMNNEVFTKEQLGVSGVLYYTLESGDFTATKKMIIVE